MALGGCGLVEELDREDGDPVLNIGVTPFGGVVAGDLERVHSGVKGSDLRIFGECFRVREDLSIRDARAARPSTTEEHLEIGSEGVPEGGRWGESDKHP